MLSEGHQVKIFSYFSKHISGHTETTQQGTSNDCPQHIFFMAK